MITFIRWILLKQKEIKWKLAFWQYLDHQAAELIRDPDKLEKKIISGLANIIYQNSELHKAGEDELKTSASKTSA